MFNVAITSVLTGASVRQLGYWRKSTESGTEPLLVPEAKRSGRYLYSWADIVALRSIVYLRQEKSLFKIRNAVDYLRNLEADDWGHLSKYRLISTKQTIIVATPKGEHLDVEHAPGTVLDQILIKDVLEPFDTLEGKHVPSLDRPRNHLIVNPAILSGYPVIEGSRVPFDVVAELADEGLQLAEIREIYPSVTKAAIVDSQGFAQEVAAAVAA